MPVAQSASCAPRLLLDFIEKGDDARFWQALSHSHGQLSPSALAELFSWSGQCRSAACMRALRAHIFRSSYPRDAVTPCGEAPLAFLRLAQRDASESLALEMRSHPPLSQNALDALLLRSAACHSFASARFLLQCGANPHAQTDAGETPLMLACARMSTANIAFIETLLPVSDANQRDAEELRAFDLFLQMVDNAAKKDYFSIATAVGSEPISADVEVRVAALFASATDCRAPVGRGCEPLLAAFRWQNPAFVRAVLPHCDPLSYGDSPFTPLMHAINARNLDIVCFLLPLSDLNAQSLNDLKWTALDFALLAARPGQGIAPAANKILDMVASACLTKKAIKILTTSPPGAYPMLEAVIERAALQKALAPPAPQMGRFASFLRKNRFLALAVKTRRPLAPLPSSPAASGAPPQIPNPHASTPTAPPPPLAEPAVFDASHQNISKKRSPGGRRL